MLTSKQRAYLRGLATNYDTILQVGKGGISPDLIKQAESALAAREMIKGKVLENSMISPEEAAQNISEKTRSEVVLVIGSKFVLYKKNQKKPVIQVPKTVKSTKNLK